jgi:hypothetical protein
MTMVLASQVFTHIKKRVYTLRSAESSHTRWAREREFLKMKSSDEEKAKLDITKQPSRD